MRWLISRPIAVYTLLGLVILGPMLLPGYVFALDMVFGPHISLPPEINASYPFYAVLKLLTFIMPVWLIQKLMLLSIIVISGLGAHRLTQYLLDNEQEATFALYFAGISYIVNPFTYTRFMDGHFAVLLGYAVLPFFTRALLELLFGDKFTLKQSCKIALYACLCIVFSVHAIGYIVIIGLVTCVVFMLRSRRKRQVLLQGAKYLGIATVLFAVLNSYWLVPTAAGNTPRESLIQNFDMRHFLSFRTDGATDLGVIGNAISLHGYWGDREERYILPQNANPLWPVLLMLILALVAYGTYRMRHNATSLILAVSACIALILAIGVAATPFNHINTWLINTLPFFRGFREPQKFLSIVALFYATVGGAGVAWLFNSRMLSRIKPDHVPWLISAVLIVPFLYTPTFAYGFAGQLRGREYPVDWAHANTSYISKSQGNTLFLPWHQYMYFDFADRVISNPTPVYFGDKVIYGDNVEIGLIHRQTNNLNSQLIEQSLAKEDPHEFPEMLNALHIEYVVVSKNADWQRYEFLDHAQLKQVSDTETLKIYKNPLFK